MVWPIIREMRASASLHLTDAPCASQRMPAFINRVLADNFRLVGNPEVIRKLALGNRSDGFRSCLTRSHVLPLSSVARPEKCRPTQTKQEHEHSIGKSEYVNQGELKGRLGQARPLWRTVPLLGERNLFRVMISRTGLSSAGRV